MAVVKLQNSSSFRLASFFTLLLIFSAGIIIYLISIANGTDFKNTDIEEIRNMINALGISIIILLFIVLAVAYFVSVYVVDLINTIADTADDIMQKGDLSRRIPVHHERDDLSKLAYVLNNMFDKIEELLEGVRHVSDNIAHDLRTPLTRLRNKIEQFDGSEQEKENLILEADKIINIFNALLRIARIESGKEIIRSSKVDIKCLVNDVVDLYEPLAEDKNQKISVSIQESEIKGDKDLLFQTLANLLDNSIKFTPQKGKIKISGKQKDNEYHLSVSDSGPGIAKQDKEKVFTRFYRGEACRSSAGQGLGLSLVKAVMDAHKAKIKLTSKKSGLTTILIFTSQAQGK